MSGAAAALAADLARLREESQVTNQMRGALFALLLLATRLRLFRCFATFRPLSRLLSLATMGACEAQRQPINQNIYIYITFRHNLIFILFSASS